MLTKENNTAGRPRGHLESTDYQTVYVVWAEQQDQSILPEGMANSPYALYQNGYCAELHTDVLTFQDVPLNALSK